MRKKIVISAINSFWGGQLSIVQDCLKELLEFYGNDIEITALVYDKPMVGIEGITYYEFPKVKSKWFGRLYYEYFFSTNFQKKKSLIFGFRWQMVHPM